MAGARKPMALNLANGGKNWTKKEIHDRLNSELQPVADGIVAPDFLLQKQREAFDRIATQLQTLGIMGETDCDMLARYIVAQDLYTQAVKDLRKLTKDRPKANDYENKGHYFADLDIYYTMIDSATKRQDRYFKQATTAAAKLGLTISDRCRLVVPVKEEAPKVNKFARFGKVAGSE